MNPLNPFETIAVITGLLSVWLTVKENIWCWLTGLVSVVFYLIVFYQARLYADMGLQVVYIYLQFYGWYQWLYGGRGRTELQVSRAAAKFRALLALIFITCTGLMAYLLSRHTDAAMPLWDSAATVLSLIAQWMMAKKLLECWLVWITADVLYVWIFFSKGLYQSLGLYAIFLILATLGFFEWRKSLQSLQPA
jgi:nicotinamide mononucleotide transporter